VPRSTAVFRSPIALFALTGLLATIAIAGIAAAFTHGQARQESLRDARSLTRVLAVSLLPDLDHALMRGTPASIDRMDDDVRAVSHDEPLLRVKVWTASGRILYSDEHRLIGAVYPLRDDDREVLADGGADAEISDLRRPENRFERGDGRVLEVYLPITAAHGQRLLFETYLRDSAVNANGRKLFLAFLPAVLVGLALLWLVQLPVAASLMRRIRGHQAEHERLLIAALDSSDRERQRIAGDLHDTVVPELLGVSHELTAAGERSDHATPDENRQAFHAAAAQLRSHMRALRTLLVDMYPASVQSAGLNAALEQIVARVPTTATVHAELCADGESILDAEREELVLRAAQEALRNVNRHAAATNVTVSLRRVGANVVLTVDDDGIGFDTETLTRSRAEGHFGLDLIADRARRLLGTLATTSAPGRGTTVRLELPAR
jgi:signal transduction histidine kinase